MMNRRHMCLSISGALKNWKDKEWQYLALQNNMTVKELKAYFMKLDFEGHKVHPMEGCDNFDNQTGCLGHD